MQDQQSQITTPANRLVGRALVWSSRNSDLAEREQNEERSLRGIASGSAPPSPRSSCQGILFGWGPRLQLHSGAGHMHMYSGWLSRVSFIFDAKRAPTWPHHNRPLTLPKAGGHHMTSGVRPKSRGYLEPCLRSEIVPSSKLQKRHCRVSSSSPSP